MHDVDTIRKLLIRGVELNDWILEMPSRLDNGHKEWASIVTELAKHDTITVRRIEEEKYQKLVDRYECGIDAIDEYLGHRHTIEDIKASILAERVMNA